MLHARRVLWVSVVVSGSAMITVFVWHRSAIVAVPAGLYLVLTEGPWRLTEPVGVPLAGPGLIAIGFPLLGLLRSGS